MFVPLSWILSYVSAYPHLAHTPSCIQQLWTTKLHKHSADSDTPLDLIADYLDDPGGSPTLSTQPFNYVVPCHSHENYKKKTQNHVYYLVYIQSTW